MYKVHESRFELIVKDQCTLRKGVLAFLYLICGPIIGLILLLGPWLVFVVMSQVLQHIYVFVRIRPEGPSHIYIYFLWEAWENFIQLLTYQPVICNQLMLLKRCAQTPSVLTGSFQIAKERFYLHVPGTPHIWWKNLWIWEFMKSEAHEKWCGWWGWWWWWWWLLLVLLLLLSLWWLRWLWWWWSYAMNFCDTVIFLR